MVQDNLHHQNEEENVKNVYLKFSVGDPIGQRTAQNFPSQWQENL